VKRSPSDQGRLNSSLNVSVARIFHRSLGQAGARCTCTRSRDPSCRLAARERGIGVEPVSLTTQHGPLATGRSLGNRRLGAMGW